MHHVDRETPWDEIWEAMEVLRTQGKIIYVGSSNHAGWHIAKAQEAAWKRSFFVDFRSPCVVTSIRPPGQGRRSHNAAAVR